MKKTIGWAGAGMAIAGLGLALFRPLAGQELFPDGPGRDTVFLVCVQCHTPTRISDAKLTADDWEFIVYDMIGRGAPVYKDDIEDVTKYLVDNFAVDRK